MGNANLIK